MTSLFVGAIVDRASCWNTAACRLKVFFNGAAAMQMEWGPQSRLHGLPYERERSSLCKAQVTWERSELSYQLVPFTNRRQPPTSRSFACCIIADSTNSPWHQAVASLPGQIHPGICHILPCGALLHKRKWDPIYHPNLQLKPNNEAFELEALSKENQETGVPDVNLHAIGFQ